MWIVPVAIKPSTGAIEAFDHSRTLESLEVLINRGVANPPALPVELFEDVACAEVTGFAPQQIEHHSPLLAESHAQVSAMLECILKGALVTGSLWQKGFDSRLHGSRRNDFRLNPSNVPVL